MRRPHILPVVVIALASTLAACGGGGGGSPLPTTSNPPGPKTAKIRATFGSSNTTPHSAFRRPMASKQSTVVAQIVPTQQVAAPDAYLTGSLTTGVDAQAVLDTTDGSAIPSPLPSVTWSQSGNPAPIPTTYPTWPVSACSCQQVFNAEVVGTPAQPGQTTITMTSDGTTQNLTMLTYREMGLRSTLDTSNSYNALTGAMFDANGVSEQADTQPDTDVYMDASTTPAQVVFPYGAIAVGYNDAMNAVGDVGKACAAIPTTSTAVSPSYNGTGANTYCFNTHDGRIGKWMLMGGDQSDIFGAYMIEDSNSSFAY